MPYGTSDMPGIRLFMFRLCIRQQSGVTGTLCDQRCNLTVEFIRAECKQCHAIHELEDSTLPDLPITVYSTGRQHHTHRPTRSIRSSGACQSAGVQRLTPCTGQLLLLLALRIPVAAVESGVVRSL